MQKLTKAQFMKALEKKPLECTEHELRFIFNVLGFDLKEFGYEDNRLTFEIHYRCEYVVKVEMIDGLVVFSNLWRTEDDGETSYHSEIMFSGKTLDFLDLFFRTFGAKILQTIDYNPAWAEGWSMVDSVEEGREYWEIFCQLGKAEHYNEPDALGTPKGNFLN